MSSRTSTRQAAVKANEAFQHTAGPSRRGGRGKRKGSTPEEAPKTKREKKEEKPQVEDAKPAEVPQPPKPEEPKEPKATGGGVNGTPKEPEKKEAAPPQGPKGKEGPPEAKAEKLSEGPAVKESEDREEAVPSNVLEKGIIYFFFRPRVSIDQPEDISEVARSFIVLRPLPRGAELTGGPIGDNENCRLLLLPKKILPTSPRERYSGFVEKANASAKTIRESFLASDEYETKTKGTQHTPAAVPAAEGVYAITSTTRSSHLAYILTIPGELSEVQKDFGLNKKGSFIMSAKNPKFPGPLSARLSKSPDYPPNILEEFRDLRWVPMQPHYLDYPNTQFLIIGEAQGKLGKGGETEEKEPGKEKAGEEIEYLEHENEVRAYPLRGNDTVFDDLGMSLDKYPKVPTTWG